MRVYKTIVFERGDYVEQPQGIFIYLGNGYWLNRDTKAVYTGVVSTAIKEGNRLNLPLKYIADGNVVKALLQGIPEQKDIYINK